MYYVIQENLFKEKYHKTLVELFDKFGFEYELVKFIPFIHEVEFKTERKDVFCFGAIKMAYVAEKYGWTPGSLMNDNHDYEVYSKEYGKENMLNGDGTVISFTDKIPFNDFMFFARPCKDTKVFSGQVFTQESWRDYVEECKKNDAANLIKEETKILVSPLKNIQQEVRCWVVGGKVITASRYKLGNFVTYENYDDESFYIDFAQKMVDIYQPADCFVLDVCLADDELKIVEVNCINCSGFYDVNLYKLIEALENFYS